jgi:uncharacterized protein (TIGR00251 family)
MERFSIKVVPRAHKDEVIGFQGEILKVRLRAPPVEGAANESLRELLSVHFGVKKSQVSIVSGKTSRLKIIQISD